MITYMMVQTRQRQKSSHGASQRCVFYGQDPCWGVISRQVGPAVPVIVPGQ